jgi:hypothetical protein
LKKNRNPVPVLLARPLASSSGHPTLLPTPLIYLYSKWASKHYSFSLPFGSCRSPVWLLLSTDTTARARRCSSCSRASLATPSALHAPLHSTRPAAPRTAPLKPPRPDAPYPRQPTEAPRQAPEAEQPATVPALWNFNEPFLPPAINGFEADWHRYSLPSASLSPSRSL